MTDDENQRGAATARAIEEAHLTLQQKHRKLRAVSEDAPPDGSDPSSELIEFREYVLTFFELLRPYLQTTPGLREYWHGSLAAHPEDPHDTLAEIRDYYSDNSAGVWRMSSPDLIEVPPPARAMSASGGKTAVADGSGIPDTLADWHEAASLGPTERVVSIVPPDGDFDTYGVRFVTFGVVALRDLDDWSISHKTVREAGEGFMAGETAERTVRQTEPPRKIVTAKRMLVEAAEELDALADLDTADHREAEYDYSDLI